MPSQNAIMSASDCNPFIMSTLHATRAVPAHSRTTVLSALRVQVAADCSRLSTAQPVLSTAAGKQDSAKPPTSHLALGDSRINPFHTSYHSDFSPPFTWQASLAAAQDAPAEGFCISAGADRPLQQQRGQQSDA